MFTAILLSLTSGVLIFGWIKGKRYKESFYLIRRFLARAWDWKGITKEKEFWNTEFLLFLILIFLLLLGLCRFFDECNIVGMLNFSYYNSLERYIDAFTGDWSGDDIRAYLLIPLLSFCSITLIPQISLIVRHLRNMRQFDIEENLEKVDDLLSTGKINQEEYDYLRKQIFSKIIK